MMKWKNLFILFLLLFNIENAFSKNTKFYPPPSDRVKTNIDFDWKFISRDFPCEEETHQVNELPWQTVHLPHDWSIEGPFLREQNTTQGFLPMTIGWYKKSIFLPECYEHKKVFIVFDGVYRSSDVWMNYAHIGHHESGYTSFVYDLTDYVRFGNRIPNGLRVRVDARRHEQDMYEGCGIYRHAWLVVTNKLHVAYWGAFISTSKVSRAKATIEVKTKVKNENCTSRKCKLTTKIIDAEGIVVAEMAESHSIPANSEYEFIQRAQIDRPHLWSLDDPYLYKAYSIIQDDDIIVDTYETIFGIRTFRFDSQKGFFLNGERIKLRGFNAHYDFAGLGTALPDRIHWNAMMAMKKAGFNFYRSSHNPATPERLDVCDQIGMLVWDEIERKLESHEVELALVRETIVRDRNHPSVILWSLENESPLEGTVYGTSIISAATALAHKLDPTRLTTFAASMPVNKKGYGDAVDVVSYNYHWKRADQDHIDNPHWKIGLLSEYSAARGRRGVYGIEHFRRAEDDAYFDLYNGMVQNMYQMCSRVESYWRRIKAREYFAGGCLWSGIDAWGEGNVWPLVSRGDGALDLCFFPKDVYYYFVSQWTEAPMVHIFPHWNWEGKEGQPIDVWCYTNCDSVELLLNDHSLGIQARPPEPAFWTPDSIDNVPPAKSETQVEHLEWKVPYEPGTIRASGLRAGQSVCIQEIHTTGKPAKINLCRLMTDFVHESEIEPVIADGRDIVVIKAAILDEAENVVPTADNLVNFYVERDEKIIGVGNGNIASHEPNKATSRKAYNGLCVAIIQSTQTAGEFTVRATSPGLISDRIKIKSIAPEPVKIVVFAKPYRLSKLDQTSTITAEIQDKFGSIILTAENKVTFKLNGPALFENDTDTFTTNAINGKAVVKIKPAERGGSVIITALSAGLRSGKVDVIVK